MDRLERLANDAHESDVFEFYQSAEPLRFVMCVALTDSATATVSIRVYPARDEGIVYDLRTWTVESVRVEEEGLEDAWPTDLKAWSDMVDRLMTWKRINKAVNELRGT